MPRVSSQQKRLSAFEVAAAFEVEVAVAFKLATDLDLAAALKFIDGKESWDDPAEDSQQEDEYVTGLKLVLILTSVTIVYFLVMVDMSILATVSPRLAILAWLIPLTHS